MPSGGWRPQTRDRRARLSTATTAVAPEGLALGAVVALAAVAYGAAAQLVPKPLLNPDELRYTLAAPALSDGDWLDLRVTATIARRRSEPRIPTAFRSTASTWDPEDGSCARTASRWSRTTS